mmetsp:Transcript_68286/g.119023  ORF Transcript_68286/g.119023 Transcript_68286/m.119023 type:complete len:307 (-) Transcript_68286:61-981(-)
MSWDLCLLWLVLMASLCSASALPGTFPYRLLVTDMDGTLLRSNGALSERNVAALRRLTQEGVQVAIATGRPSRALQPFVDQLGLSSLPVVVFNGALMARMQAGASVPSEVLFSLPLPPADVDAVLAVGEALDLCISYVLLDGSYCRPRNDEHRELLRKFETLEGISQTIVDSFDGLAPPLKLVLLAKDPDAAAAEARSRLPKELQTHVISAEMHVEFLNAAANKGTALPRLAELLGVTLEETIAFGDGSNDLEMLRAAGYGVAMSNAKRVTKDGADHVLEWSNDEDGVAQFLEKLLSKPSNEEAEL